MSEFKIESIQYTTSERKTMKVVIDGQIHFVPKYEKNWHYKEIMRQVQEEGLTIKDAD
jgi:hypothetical protein